MPAFAVTDDLNWTVSHRDLFFSDLEGKPVKWEEKVAVVRDDNGKCLGAVSPGYETVQNKVLLKLINPLVEEGLLSVEKMGYLSHGAKVFAQAQINKEFQVVGESYKAYITLLNGHTGNASVAIGPSAVRVFCSNTFAMAYSDISEKHRHMEGVNERVLESSAITNYVDSSMKKYSESVEKLAMTHCSAEQFYNSLEVVYQKEVHKMRDSFVSMMSRLFYEGKGTEGRTFYDAFNAVTEYASNHSRKTESGRFNYSNFGQGSRINQRAMRVMTELASV